MQREGLDMPAIEVIGSSTSTSRSAMTDVVLNTPWGYFSLTFKRQAIFIAEFLDEFPSVSTLDSNARVGMLLERSATQLVADHDDLTQRMLALWAAVWTSGGREGLHVDLQGTAFQKKVWCAVREIPLGQTMSYESLAESLGSKYLTRAVARAVSQNKIALIIPCHRVIAKNGATHGYRWGAARKAKLLNDEQKWIRT